MKKNKEIILICFGLFLLLRAEAQTISAETRISYEEAIRWTCENSHVIKQNSLLIKEKALNDRSNLGLYMPKISLSANYMHMSNDLTMDLTPVRDAITPLYSTLANYGSFSGIPNPDPNTNPFMPILPDSISTAIIRDKLNHGLTEVENGDWNPILQKKEFSTLDVNAQWVLYAGGRIRAANYYSGLEMVEANALNDQKTNEVLNELTERYFALAFSYQLLQVRKDVLIGLQKHLADAEKLYREGLINQADWLFAQYHHSDAEKELMNAERNYTIIRRALNNSMGVEDTVEVFPTTPLFYNDSIESLDYYLRLAREHNPQMNQIEVKREMAEVNRKVQRASLLPEVAAQGSYNIANHDLSSYAPDWTIGVGLRWTLFDGLSSYHKTRSARLKLEQVDEFKAAAEDDLETYVVKLYREMEMYREQIHQCDKSMAYATEYLRVMEKSYKEQMTEESKLVDAKLALAKVNIEKLQMMYYYDVSLSKLLSICGSAKDFSSYLMRKSKTANYKSLND